MAEKSERLDKAVANRFSVSRKEVKEKIRRGEVTVDGVVVTNPEHRVFENSEISFGGLTKEKTEFVYIMMNKPAGILTATTDKTRKTVVDLVPTEISRKGIFPVGRLDKDTTGLLIITNNGEWAHRIVSPKHHVQKEYIVTLDGAVTDEAIEGFKKGVTLADGEVCKPAVLERLDDKNTARVILREGKYHQIKRMFGVFGLGVNALTRASIGGLKLDENLGLGECREMTKKEVLLAEEKNTCNI